MEETTSVLFSRLRQAEDGRDLLDGLPPQPDFPRKLRELLEARGMTTAVWIAAANIIKTYGYQILRGERTPGRDILLRTALALSLSLRETQRLLALGNCGALYPRLRRDAAVIFALNQGMSLLETEELLASLPERSLYAGEP